MSRPGTGAELPEKKSCSARFALWKSFEAPLANGFRDAMKVWSPKLDP